MAESVFKPHRGKRSTMESKNPILERGEFFIENPETGVGTGAGKIKIGDGETAYTDLPYFNSGTITDDVPTEGSSNAVSSGGVYDALLEKIDLDTKGVANGVATLDSNGRIPYAQLPESSMELKGLWNAATNTPHIDQGVGDNGDFYIVDVAGTWQDISFNVNDRIIFVGNGVNLWKKLVAGEVLSVNGRKGAVTLTKEDVQLSNVDNTSDAVKNVALATKAVQDESGNNIKANYASTMEIIDHTLYLKNKNGNNLANIEIPDENTVYMEGTGISLGTNNSINHSNSITPGIINETTKTLNFGDSFSVPSITYDAQGHLTEASRAVLTLPSSVETTYTLGTSENNITLTSGETVQSVTAPYAIKAAKDSEGDALESTYANDISISDNTVSLLSKSGAELGSIELPDTIDTAEKAIADESGNNIKDTYGSDIEISNHTLNLKNKNGETIGSITIPDTTYILGSSNNTITLTPSVGNTQSITVPYAENAGVATKANTDAYDNSIYESYGSNIDITGNKLSLISKSGVELDSVTISTENTTYTLGTNGNTVTLTDSDENTQSITTPFATNSTNAEKASKDASGNVITTTYANDLTLNNNTLKLLNKAGTELASVNITNTDTTYTLGTNGNTVTLTPSSGTAQSITVPYATNSANSTNATNASYATTQTQKDGSTKIATTAYVDTAISELPSSMVFKGSLGIGGTITELPAASSSNSGWTYAVITAGTYDGKYANIGDMFSSNGTEWILIPSGTSSGTVTSVKIEATEPIVVDNSSAITTSGTRVLSHSNSGITAGTYKSVTVNATGHITAGTNPTTLSGYGITDAMSKNNPTGTGELSLNRKADTIAGNYSVAEGNQATASGEASHAEGYGTKANGSYSHAEGYITTASGYSSHAEGRMTTASGGDGSHAEGCNTTASGGDGSHAEGSYTIASGNDSHAEGDNTKAKGANSHAEGYYTIANKNQHVQGKFNIEDSSETYADIVGNGTGYSNRSNAYTLDWNGNGVYSGTVTATNIPAPPTSNGDYLLKCTVNNGSATYQWVNFSTVQQS